jgi:hypothetical protein
MTWTLRIFLAVFSLSGAYSQNSKSEYLKLNPRPINVWEEIYGGLYFYELLGMHTGSPERGNLPKILNGYIYIHAFLEITLDT